MSMRIAVIFNGDDMSKEIRTITERIPINSDLDIVAARLKVREVARDMGFGTIDQARISLAASELARTLAQNLGGSGEIVVSGIDSEGHRGIQVESISPNKTLAALKKPNAFSSAFALVDEGYVDTEDTHNIRVTLMKWLS